MRNILFVFFGLVVPLLPNQSNDAARHPGTPPSNWSSAGSSNAGSGGWQIMGTWTVTAPPVLAISKSHAGTLSRGQSGAIYTILVSNMASAGPSNGVVTVAEIVPVGLTVISMTGAGWVCASNSCSRSDVLAPGAVFAAILVTVNVAGDAPSPVVNQASVSGGDSAPANASDSAVLLSTSAMISAPAPGSTLTTTTATFQWNSVSGADKYWLDVGISVGSGDLWGSALTTSMQAVSGMPCDGRTVYVQLYTHIGNAWTSPQRYTYTAPSGCFAILTSPTPGITLPGSAVTFQWAALTGADQYWLDVGNIVGRGDLAAGSTTAASIPASGLPCDGRSIYVQLFTHWNGAWLSPQRYTYTAAGNCASAYAEITSPVPQTVLSSNTVAFQWSAPTNADQYWLDVGTILGTGDLFASALTATSKIVSGLPCDGRTLYVQLYTHVTGSWLYTRRYTYTAPAGCNSNISQIVSPAPSSALSAAAVTFTWNAVAAANQYWLDVGTSVGTGNLFAASLTATSQAVAGLPCDGRTVYVQLYTRINGTWQSPQRYTNKAAVGCTP